MKHAFVTFLVAGGILQAQTALPAPLATSLSEVRRIYVAPLAGSASESLREVIIASLNSTGLFTLTDDVSRADAILKGAADDRSFIDVFDSENSIAARTDGGLYGSGSGSNRSGGGYGGLSGAERDAYHVKERKHEAYAAVRLVNRAGDVLWSTTQESGGAKFRGARTDVGAKIARQITLDMDRDQRTRVNNASVRP